MTERPHSSEAAARARAQGYPLTAPHVSHNFAPPYRRRVLGGPLAGQPDELVIDFSRCWCGGRRGDHGDEAA